MKIPSITKAWIYGGIIVGAGIGIARILERGALVKRGGRLMLVGDSLSVGLAPPLKAVAVESGVSFVHVGETGTRIDQWSSNSTVQGIKLNQTLASFAPTLILVSLGTNDEYLKKYGTADVLAKQKPYIDALMVKLKATGAEVAWIGPPTNAYQSPELRAYLASVVGKSRYFPSEKYTLPRQQDGLHPTVAGYAGWTGLIWQWVMQ